MNPDKIQEIRKYIRVIEREVDNQLKDQKLCCGISLAQCHAMLEMGRLHECTVAELSENLNLDKSTLSRTIENLVQRGLVERITQKEDRRRILVRLTDSGRAMSEGIDKSCNTLYDSIITNIPNEKQPQVLESMKLLSEAIKRFRKEEKAS